MGRFWSIDPLSEQYNSTYTFAENKLGLGIELEGLEIVPTYGMEYANAKTSEDFRRIQQAKNWEAAGTIVGVFIWAAPIIVSTVGWRGVGTFFLNEVKDEALSVATDGASDIFDITKMASKFLKKGFKKISAKVVNKSFTDVGDLAPYDVAFDVIEGVTEGAESFVRVHGDSNKVGGWMMKASEIEGLSAEQIKNKFALPSLPTHMSNVTLPKGTKIRTGVAGKVKGWGNGGGVQVELLQEVSKDAFTNTRKIK